jgi:hypothetical protein
MKKIITCVHCDAELGRIETKFDIYFTIQFTPCACPNCAKYIGMRSGFKVQEII